ncbi:MAG: hypothetical protein FIB01_15130 [Gemmatimonadetes bacterium]|nr:hypothetical protein [Gemmatimonadota bacterium]
MGNHTLRRCVGTVLLVVSSIQNAGCAVSPYNYEPHPLPGAPLDTLAIRQLFGESVRLTLRSGTILRLDDVTLERDTIWGAGMRVPLDSVARVDIVRSDPAKAVVPTTAAAATSGIVAGAALAAVVVTAVFVGFALLLRAIAQGLGEAIQNGTRSHL